MPKQSSENRVSITQGQVVKHSDDRITLGNVVMYQGTIPPAAEIARYEETLPGAADRILKMAEEQSKHRQEMETKMLEASIKSERNGQFFGFIILGVAVVAGFALIFADRSPEGFAALFGAIVSIILLFILSRQSMKRELDEKDEELRRRKDREKQAQRKK